jgi:predicted HicB family RNase H-like nuclease
MAVYSLLFGHVEWPDEPTHSEPRAALAAEHERVARLTLRVPSSLKSRLEESAELAGVSPQAFVERALRRSVDPRLGV